MAGQGARGRPRKTNNKSVAPKRVTTVDERKYYCTRCPREFDKQDGNFLSNNSPLYENNNKRITICNTCMDELLEHYTTLLGDEKLAIRRLCEKFDWYWSDVAYDYATKATNYKSMIRAYVSRLGLAKFRGKTYDDTLEEERVSNIINNIEDYNSDDDGINISAETVKRFGKGLSIDEYEFLEEQYNDWITRYECTTKAQEEIYKNLSISQWNILNAQVNNGDVPKAQKAFQELLNTANIKPAQTAAEKLTEENTLGSLIAKWENEYEEPIPEPPERWKDYYGIGRYVSIWFMGHLSKMLGLKNSYSRLYEEEMEKFKIERPEYADNEDALFDAVFGSNINTEESDAIDDYFDQEAMLSG